VSEDTIEVAGLSRSFVLSVPAGYDPNVPTPLVFGWHGLGGSGSLLRAYTGVESEAAGRAIFVYPDGRVLPSYGATGWELAQESVDLDFFDALWDRLASAYCIDEDRVFSYGHSFGGYMSNTIGCYRSAAMRGIAPVAGGGPYGGCGGPVAVWISHAMDDPTVDFAEGVGTRDRWLELNGCSSSTNPVDPSPCVEHADCDAGGAVVFCAGPTGGHGWPDYADAGIWHFFAGQS
jgi:poly(3-hydroxybutyrate) depolymerase